MNEPVLPDPMPDSRMAVAVFASGRGSNLQVLHQASLSGELAIRLVGVVSDRPQSGAIAYANQQQIPAKVLAPKDFADREAFDLALMQAAADYRPQLIVCAGYMRIISPAGIAAAPCPIINIHPSLLPKYPGLNTHARALAADDAEHGASVHLVNDVLDGGRILAQVRIPIQADDESDSLAERLLPHEHAILIATVRAISRGEISLEPLI
jgi:phosphoribosylglycinamide formyltransferase-1